MNKRRWISRNGSDVLLVWSGRRYALLERDTDGDLILTLTDRDTNREADASVVTGASPITVAHTMRQFIRD